MTEQLAIAQFLDACLADIGHAVQVAHSEISLLREYRTRLIADVVTGKLDVREATLRLPDEAEEPGPPDALTDAADAATDDLDAAPEEAGG